MFITYNETTKQIYSAAETNEPHVPEGCVTVKFEGSFADFPAHPTFCKFVNGAVVHAPELEAQMAPDYAAKRVAEYPPIADQLDALWKGGAAAESMKAAVLAVKAKYPKE